MPGESTNRITLLLKLFDWILDYLIGVTVNSSYKTMIYLLKNKYDKILNVM